MAPKNRTKTTQEAGTSSQAPLRAMIATRTSWARANAPHPLGLVNPNHIEHFNCFSRSVIATRYYVEKLIRQIGFFDDIQWLFAMGGMGQFIEMKDHTYHVEVTSGT